MAPFGGVVVVGTSVVGGSMTGGVEVGTTDWVELVRWTVVVVRAAGFLVVEVELDGVGLVIGG
ncbi:MAG: hypothetical protein H0U92_04435 [Actinobacteria bacterium]|nr:hypothetical protein [Actinomycetota bacterium]